jgi:DNA-binding NarL/FixJ family response regulator
MSFKKQPVTVAIADVDHDRRTCYERILQDEPDIKLLTNIKSCFEAVNDARFVDRRFMPRTNVTECENELARIKRLKPLVLLVNLDLCANEDDALMTSLRRECPEMLVVLLADDSVDESKIIQALKTGVRGYLQHQTANLYLRKAIQVVAQGEAWLPRKMVGDVMNIMLNLGSRIGFHR